MKARGSNNDVAKISAGNHMAERVLDRAAYAGGVLAMAHAQIMLGRHPDTISALLPGTHVHNHILLAESVETRGFRLRRCVQAINHRVPREAIQGRRSDIQGDPGRSEGGHMSGRVGHVGRDRPANFPATSAVSPEATPTPSTSRQGLRKEKPMRWF